jgi:hypothetical protein
LNDPSYDFDRDIKPFVEDKMSEYVNQIKVNDSELQ